jgi:hypothetical protein
MNWKVWSAIIGCLVMLGSIICYFVHLFSGQLALCILAVGYLLVLPVSSGEKRNIVSSPRATEL